MVGKLECFKSNANLSCRRAAPGIFYDTLRVSLHYASIETATEATPG